MRSPTKYAEGTKGDSATNTRKLAGAWLEVGPSAPPFGANVNQIDAGLMVPPPK
jgi:hypothetical protein